MSARAEIRGFSFAPTARDNFWCCKRQPRTGSDKVRQLFPEQAACRPPHAWMYSTFDSLFFVSG